MGRPTPSLQIKDRQYVICGSITSLPYDDIFYFPSIVNLNYKTYFSVLNSGVGTFRFFIGLLSGQDALLGTHPFMKIPEFQKLSLKNAIKF